MNREQMAHEMKVHIIRKYHSQANAAAHWKVSGAMVSKVVNAKIDPPGYMLADAGFERVDLEPVYRKIKKEK